MPLQPGPIHETMAGQIDHQKPERLKPGKDIGIEVKDANSITVVVPSMEMQATVEYLPGPDLYAVEILRGDEISSFDRVYCDQLGELLFGDEAQPWTQPFGGIQILDADGNVVEERTF
jgi:hypothetical protein